MRNLGRIFLIICLVSASLPPAQARTRKGDKFWKEGQQAEIRKQYEAAVDFYEKALAEDPADPGYQMGVRRTRFQAAHAHIDAGQKLREAGQLETSLEEFRKAYALDPSSSMAEQEYRRTKQMIEADKAKGAAATPQDRGLTPAEQSQKDADEKIDRIQAAPELKPITRQISALKMNNQPVKVLYETVGKLAGINVLFDPEYQPPPGGRQNFTVDLSNTTLEEALDYLSVQTKSYWKPISSNTIFVTSDNVAKRRDYEDYVVKTFYIKNTTTIQELQELSTTVRSVTEIRRAFTFNAQNAILVRGTTDQVALAEKLIADLDKPKSEVVVDVIVMEANRGRTRDLAAALTTGGKPGIELPIVYGATGGTTETGEKTDTKLPVVALNRLDSIGLGDFSIAIPGALLQAVMSDSQTRVLQQPQVRAIDNQKASLKIGDKVPYASGSFQPGFGGVGAGVSPLVSTQFQFYDVGVNVDITPKVHNREEVSMHVELEISNVSGRVELGGISQPIISQKKVVHDIRIREGEVNLLGGLMQTQDTRSVTGIPGLASIPVIGRLFGPEHKERNTGELLIALVPHVVRAPEFNEANLRGIAAGTDATVKLSYSPRQEPPAPAATQPPPPATQPEAPKPEAPAAPATPAPAGPARVTFNPASVTLAPGASFTVTMMVENVTDLFASPMRLKWDPKILRLTAIRQGPLLTSDGKQVSFSENTLNDAGEASITLNRLPGSGGVNGSGGLVILTFQAAGKGVAEVGAPDLQLNNSQMQPIAASAPVLKISVQ